MLAMHPEQRATTSMATGIWSKIMCHVVLWADMFQRALA